MAHRNADSDARVRKVKGDLREEHEEAGFTHRVKDGFRAFAKRASEVLGTPWAFALAVAVVLVWAVTGPLFGYSDTWQLIINTGTTIVTFLMVFLIQNTQNRDAKALHLKLDELLAAMPDPRTALVDVEELSDETLDRLQEEFRQTRREEEARGRGVGVRSRGGDRP